MAQDWIKIRKDLPTDPAVIVMASDMGVTINEVVGRLVRVWSWYDSHCVDGYARIVTACNAVSVTCAQLGALLNDSAIIVGMQKTGWIQDTEQGAYFPNHERHLSQGAKTRALTARRVEKARNAASVTKALPEKEKEKDISPIYAPLSFDEFWRAYPLKSKRQEAAEAFANLAPEELPAVLQAAANYAATSAARNGFNMRADRWLRGEWKQWASVPYQAGKPPRLLTREEIQARASQQRKGTPWAG